MSYNSPKWTFFSWISHFWVPRILGWSLNLTWIWNWTNSIRKKSEFLQFFETWGRNQVFQFLLEPFWAHFGNLGAERYLGQNWWGKYFRQFYTFWCKLERSWANSSWVMNFSKFFYFRKKGVSRQSEIELLQKACKG